MTIAFFTHSDCPLHEMGHDHPEAPARLRSIESVLRERGIWAQLQHCEAPEATREHLLLAHDPAYVDLIFSSSPQRGMTVIDDDTSMNPYTLSAALRSAGSGIAAVDALLEGRAQRAFCAGRPPGHHACYARAMGFCFFNNIAVAARYALTRGLSRVAIIDFDVHHGNGTEDILAGDGRIVMTGLFQHPYYPYCGADSRAANMHNVPMSAGAGRSALEIALFDTWLPALDRHKPEMVFLSAGFDAHAEDPLGGLSLRDEDYVWLTEQLVDVANLYAQGRVVSMLEGGYNIHALGRAVSAHIQALAG